jgi:hypothetical protein
MKPQFALDFAPPFVGLDNDRFNTIRLGTSWSKRLKPDDEVYIQSSKDKLITSKAIVESVEVSTVGEILLCHAQFNHNEIDSKDGHESERLYQYMLKLYGPHIVNPKKKATVIYLRKKDVDAKTPHCNEGEKERQV